MERIKTRWDLEFPESRKTTQNLVDNAKRFKNEGWGNTGEQEEQIAEQITSENNRGKKEVDTIPEICGKVYALGRASGFKLRKLVKSDKDERKK